MFEGGRDTVFVAIFFNFKFCFVLFLFFFFVTTGKTGSRHHISVSFVAAELLMSRPNFLINCLNQSIPCYDNPFPSLIKQCRDIGFIVTTK